MSSFVLVIDDEEDLLELLRYNLEKEHLDVITAADGQQGREIAQRHKPDLLSIVKHIVQAHGGRIEVHSVPGAGSTFRIRLPVAADNLKRPDT